MSPTSPSTEDALRRRRVDLAEARPTDAQALIRTGSFCWNVSSGQIVCSEETFRIFGYEPATAVTMEMVLARVHLDDLAVVQRAIDRAATHKEAFDLEHRLQMPDGSVKHLRAVAHALVGAQQNLQFAGTVMDVTAHTETQQSLSGSEASLAKAEREMRLTLDSIPTITWRGASNGYVQYLNKRWFDYTGTTPEQVRGWRWKLCIHPDDLEHLVDVGTKYVASGKPIDAEARLRRFDGEYRWFLFRPTPARDESGKIVEWYGTITDIEDRKRAEAALRQSETRYQNLSRPWQCRFLRWTTRGAGKFCAGFGTPVSRISGATSRKTPISFARSCKRHAS